MRFLRQSTAVEIALGPFVDQTDGYTAETALTITSSEVRLKKNGGAWGAKNQASSATHEENGHYEISLDATDTDTLGILRVAVNESGARPVSDDFMVVPAQVYDSLFGSDVLQVDVASVVPSAMDSNSFTSALFQEIADQILKRSVATVESTAAEHSLATIILAALEASIASTTLTIKRTDGSTTHVTKTLTTDAAAVPITGIN